jgi:hypothetical protein
MNIHVDLELVEWLLAKCTLVFSTSSGGSNNAVHECASLSLVLLNT